MFKTAGKTSYEVMSSITKRKVYILPSALQKMALYTQLNDFEIGWLGLAEETEGGGGYRIIDVALLEQKATATTVDVTVTGLCKFASELGNGTDPNLVRVWGHSHVDMDTSPSHDDDDQMMKFSECPWFIRVITNQDGDIRIDLFDYERGVITHNIDWEIELQEISKDQIQKEIKQKVTKVVPKPKAKSKYNNKSYTNKSYYINNPYYFDPYSAVDDEEYTSDSIMDAIDYEAITQTVDGRWVNIEYDPSEDWFQCEEEVLDALGDNLQVILRKLNSLDSPNVFTEEAAEVITGTWGKESGWSLSPYDVYLVWKVATSLLDKGGE